MPLAIDILGITGPIYLVIALGWWFTRRAMFRREDLQAFGRFTLNLALPALLFNALSQRSVAEVLNLEYLLAYALSSLLVLGLGLFWARRVRGLDLTHSSVLAMGMSCPNSGFVGYPIMLLTLGPVAGVVLALNMVVENLLIIPILLALAQQGQAQHDGLRVFLRQTALGLLRNPLIWAIVLGFSSSLLGLSLPPPLARTVNLFAGACAVLSLFVIGGSLVGLQARGLLGQVWPVALGKLLLHPLAMILVLTWLVPVQDPMLHTAAVLTAALPMMGIYTVLSQRFGHGQMSAAAMLVTTTISFFTLSALLFVMRQSGGL